LVSVGDIDADRDIDIDAIDVDRGAPAEPIHSSEKQEHAIALKENTNIVSNDDGRNERHIMQFSMSNCGMGNNGSVDVTFNVFTLQYFQILWVMIMLRAWHGEILHTLLDKK
jgi:hypothetical protein